MVDSLKQKALQAVAVINEHKDWQEFKDADRIEEQDCLPRVIEIAVEETLRVVFDWADKKQKEVLPEADKNHRIFVSRWLQGDKGEEQEKEMLKYCALEHLEKGKLEAFQEIKKQIEARG